MQFTYEKKGEMYLYKGPQGHGGIAYSLQQIKASLNSKFGEGNYTLIPLLDVQAR